MPRHTSFRFCLDPSVEQERVLSQHVGASRFAFNQALRLHKDAYAAARRGQSQALASGVVPDGGHPGAGDDAIRGAGRVPWTGFDLINEFNGWKRSEAAGRRFDIDTTGTARVEVTGLAWQDQVLAQVFEEACVDLGRGLKAATDSRNGARKGPKVGSPTSRGRARRAGRSGSGTRSAGVGRVFVSATRVAGPARALSGR